MSLTYQKEIVSRWFQRGQQADNTFDQFICTWIAFNAALSARFGRLGDRAKVDLFASQLTGDWVEWLQADAELRDAAAELERLSPIRDDPPWPDGRQLETTVSAEDATSVMLGVYAVRNNLFHGAKHLDAMRDHVLVRTSTSVLQRLVID